MYGDHNAFEELLTAATALLAEAVPLGGDRPFSLVAFGILYNPQPNGDYK